MPDYAACVNTECPLRTKCARYQMVWSEWQPVSTFEPKKDGTCNHFMDIKDAPFEVHKRR